MQQTTPYLIEELSLEVVDKIEIIYKAFKGKALKEYAFVFEPISFNDFKISIDSKLIRGFVLSENSNYEAFLLYTAEPFKAIELNVIYVNSDKNINKKRLELTKALIDKFKNDDNYDVISYAMLGPQQSFVKDIATLGFNFTGQAVVKFEFNNPIAITIFNKLTLPNLPEGYALDTWKEEYLDQAVEVIHDSFKKAKDTKYDPRFLTADGCRSVINNVISSEYGPFLSDVTSLLLYNGRVEGISFANITNLTTINMPIMGIRKEHKHKGFGKIILKFAVAQAYRKIQNNEIPSIEMNAAVETDNYPSLKMFRRLGFREDYCYAHSFLNKKRIQLIESIERQK